MAKYSASGALSGAATGASIGSTFLPGIGTGVGAVVGGIAGLFGSKKKKKPKRISTLDPQQQALYKDYIASIRGEGPMKDMYNFDAEGYNKVFDQTVGKQAYRNFNENVIPSITGQFRQNNLGTSSYTGEALSRAGRNVQENLDAQRSANIFQGQQQANVNKQNAMDKILNMQTFAYNQPGEQKKNVLDQILSGGAEGAGQWFSDFINKKSGNSASPASPNASASPAA